jgi:hypothetical protein
MMGQHCAAERYECSDSAGVILQVEIVKRSNADQSQDQNYPNGCRDPRPFHPF